MSVTSKKSFWALLQNDALCQSKAISEIQAEFEIATGDKLISGENLKYLIQGACRRESGLPSRSCGAKYTPGQQPSSST